MKKVYIAGPQVFLPDPMKFFDEVTEIANELKLHAIIPFDASTNGQPLEIFNSNVARIKSCDGVIAYVDPFRGSEPDSGTVWECGAAFMLGKPIVYYFKDDATVEIKARRYFRSMFWNLTRRLKDVMPDGMVTERFGYPLNLMLAYSGAAVVGGPRKALMKLKDVAGW